jgi:hypothetical protein
MGAKSEGQAASVAKCSVASTTPAAEARSYRHEVRFSGL